MVVRFTTTYVIRMASKHSDIPKFNFSQELNVKTVEIQNSGCVNQGKIIKITIGHHRGSDRMVVRFTTTYVISAYHR
jgi:hypothetical protein